MPVPSPTLATPASEPDASSAEATPSPEAEARDRRLGVLFMLGAAFGFSVMSLLVKVATADFPTMQLVFARSLFMAAVTYGTMKAAGTSVWGNDRRSLVARGAIGATALSLLYVGLGELPLGDAVTIHYTAPVWTALTAAVLLGERLRPLVLGGVALCLGGVVLVAQPTVLFGDTPDPLDGLGVAATAIGAALSGTAYTFVRKLRATDAPMTIIFYLSWIGGVGALPFALLGGWVWPTLVGWALLLGIGVATHAGQVALTHGMRRLEAGTAASIGYAQVVLAFGWGVLFLDDVLDPLSIAGAGLIVASVLLIARRG